MSLRAQAIAEGFQYIARRGSKIVAFASTKAEAAREGTPEKLPSVPAKYLRGFKGEARVRRVREILRERRRGTFEPLPSDKGVSTKRSKWSVKFEQTYGERPDDIADVARLTGVPRAVLKKVYDRGLAAWSTGGHRPGASQHGWAMARVQSFVLRGPTTRTADKDLKDLVKNPRTFKDRIKEMQALNLGLVQVSVDSYKAYCVIDSTGEVVGVLATMSPPPMEVFGEDGEIYSNRCWDAPMVFFSAVSKDYQGKGIGGLLYLWAMAAGDGLFPDRASVSEKASRVWERLREMDETVWFEFDNIDAPKTHRFEDDCLVYNDPDEEHLDGVYELKHSDAVKVLRAVKPLLKKGEQYRGDLSDKLLYQAANFLFESVY